MKFKLIDILPRPSREVAAPTAKTAPVSYGSLVGKELLTAKGQMTAEPAPRSLSENMEPSVSPQSLKPVACRRRLPMVPFLQTLRKQGVRKSLAQFRTLSARIDGAFLSLGVDTGYGSEWIGAMERLG